VKRKVCIITCILTPENWKIKDKEIEEAIRLNLKPEDTPSCKHTEKVTVLSERGLKLEKPLPCLP